MIININKIFILVFCLLYFSSCSEESNQQTKTNYFSKIIREEHSPNGKFKFTLGELNDSIYPSTQLIVDFDGCGSSVYNPPGWNLGIKVHWKGDDTIIVECKSNIDKMKRNFAQCFQNKVNIKYISE
jgi:hypothetical protein